MSVVFQAATLAVVALLFSAGSAWADWDDGVAAYKRGDYVTAYQEFRPLAEQGDAKTQFNLGIMYANGVGVTENDTEAVQWYHKAAVQGYADAQASLGFMFDNGEGVPVNDAQAVKWYRKAAVQGHAKAQTNLGIMYVLGIGVPEDYVKAHMWFSLAKAEGHEGAAKSLDLVKKQMKTDQISEAQKLTAEWLEKHNN